MSPDSAPTRAKAERFTNNDAAHKRLRYEYRPPLKFPDSV